MKIPAAAVVLDYVRRLGWQRSLLRSAYVAANQLVTLSVFDCLQLVREDVNEALAAATGRYECRFLEQRESEEIARQLGGQEGRSFLEGVARGDDAYAVLDGARLANIGLYATGPTPLLTDLVVHFTSPSRYMYGGYTDPEYRGERLHALGTLRAALELFDRGVPKLVTVCERTNYRSAVSAARMGWKPCGVLYRIGAGPWQRIGTTTAARRTGMDLKPRHMEGEV